MKVGTGVSIFLVLLFFTLSGCKTEIVEETVSQYSNGSAKEVKVYSVKGKNKELIRELSFYEDGKPKHEGNFQDGKKDGKWMYWYENGFTWSKGYFKNGLREGESWVYYNNGNKNYHGYYKAGKPDSTWNFYNEAEELTQIVIYREGKIINQEQLTIPFK